MHFYGTLEERDRLMDRFKKRIARINKFRDTKSLFLTCTKICAGIINGTAKGKLSNSKEHIHAVDTANI